MPDVEGFFAYEVRCGTVTRAEAFPEARKPAYKLWIDFGELGEKRSSAQITDLYSAEELIGRQVVAVTNFPSRQVGPFLSEVLVLGFPTAEGVVLIGPDRPVPDGSLLS